MSALAEPLYEEPVERTIPREVFEHYDAERGTSAMKLVIATEAMLFVVLFFGYFYLSNGDPRWLIDAPPSLRKAIPMLVILLSSSVILYIGEQLSKKKNYLMAKLMIAITIVFGAAFLTMQCFEYRQELREMTPWGSAHGSMFYTITSIHGLHVLVGMLVLLYMLFLPRLDDKEETPYKALHSAGLYWHFVDTVWVFIVGLLYVLPNIR